MSKERLVIIRDPSLPNHEAGTDRSSYREPIPVDRTGNGTYMTFWAGNQVPSGRVWNPLAFATTTYQPEQSRYRQSMASRQLSAPKTAAMLARVHAIWESLRQYYTQD